MQQFKRPTMNDPSSTFSPLIQHLLKQRHTESSKFPGINGRPPFKSAQLFFNTPVTQSRKMEEKTVFMQVAGTMHVVTN